MNIKNINEERLKDFQDLKSKLVSLDNNTLFRYFSRRVGTDPMIEAFRKYGVGTVSIWGGGSPAFWYKDKDGRVKSVKVEAYKEQTGKPRPLVAHMQWLYNPELEFDEEHRCFFGENLLAEKTDIPVMVVEDERTAIFCGQGIKDYIWLATGESFSETPKDISDVLKGRDVVYLTTDREKAPYVNGFNSDNINAKSLVLDNETIPGLKQSHHKDVTDLICDINTRYMVLDILHPENIRRVLGKDIPDERISQGFRR